MVSADFIFRIDPIAENDSRFTFIVDIIYLECSVCFYSLLFILFCLKIIINDNCDYSHVLHQTIGYNEVVVIIEIMNK